MCFFWSLRWNSFFYIWKGAQNLSEFSYYCAFFSCVLLRSLSGILNTCFSFMHNCNVLQHFSFYVLLLLPVLLFRLFLLLLQVNNSNLFLLSFVINILMYVQFLPIRILLYATAAALLKRKNTVILAKITCHSFNFYYNFYRIYFKSFC